MSPICTHDPALPYRSLVSPTGCEFCRLALFEPEKMARMAESLKGKLPINPAVKTTAAAKICKYLPETPTRLEQCPTCPNKAKDKVYSCSLLKIECTVVDTIEGIHSCTRCPHRVVEAR